MNKKLYESILGTSSAGVSSFDNELKELIKNRRCVTLNGNELIIRDDLVINVNFLENCGVYIGQLPVTSDMRAGIQFMPVYETEKLFKLLLESPIIKKIRIKKIVFAIFSIKDFDAVYNEIKPVLDTLLNRRFIIITDNISIRTNNGNFYCKHSQQFDDILEIISKRINIKKAIYFESQKIHNKRPFIMDGNLEYDDIYFIHSICSSKNLASKQVFFNIKTQFKDSESYYKNTFYNFLFDVTKKGNICTDIVLNQKIDINIHLLTVIMKQMAEKNNTGTVYIKTSEKPLCQVCYDEQKELAYVK